MGAKEGEVYVVPSDENAPGWGISGVFCRDTILFDRWDWEISDAQFLSRSVSAGKLNEIYARTQTDRSQAVGLQRLIAAHPNGFRDSWTFINTSSQSQTVKLALKARPRMIDIFATRLSEPDDCEIFDERNSATSRIIHRTAADGVIDRATISCDGGLPDDLEWTLEVPAWATQTLALDVTIERSSDSNQGFPLLPDYEKWRASFAGIGSDCPALRRAIDDLRALLLPTAHGPYPAAGMPIFVNFFGRDALITGMMALDWQPDLLRAVLAFLAEHQGKVTDPFREEEPGKILHEIRRGELSRTNRIPFGRYYGSVDSTPLFLMAVGAYFDAHADANFLLALKPAIIGATEWLVAHLEGPSGLATFAASGSGLAVQSWKDSGNSMLDENGKEASQPLAVAEVQGYAYAALVAAAVLLPERADSLLARADRLRQSFQTLFWLPELSTYAMALDADMKPLRVLSSDPGHLLWTGIVPADIAAELVKTLMGNALWSGWGLRTLGTNAAAYNPVSYHNGSVWPHDTALFAMGLARYGFQNELHVVAKALLDLADRSPGRHMPELISGFERSGDDDPVPYTHANAPQAWAAAAVIRMAAYLGDAGSKHDPRPVT